MKGTHKEKYGRRNDELFLMYNMVVWEDSTEHCSFSWNNVHAIDLKIAFCIQETPPFDVRSGDLSFSDDRPRVGMV